MSLSTTRLHILPLLIGMFLIISIQSSLTSSSHPPFLSPNTMHPTHSQFQLNLILNENRNLPIIFVQYSLQTSLNVALPMIQSAFKKQSDIAIALIVDCKNFQYDLNRTLGVCYGFDMETYQQEQKKYKNTMGNMQEQDKRQDKFFRFDFMTPNPSKIYEKGHVLAKNHDIQNLRELNYKFNDEFLAKIIRNQVPDFVIYIEDNYDMDEFLESKSQFVSSKRAKLLFFDQNLQAPLFLKKLAARLDGIIKVGVTDNFKLAKKYDAFSDAVLLMEYNYITQKYDTQKVSYQQGSQLQDILSTKTLKRYLELQKFRDILLDFEHRDKIIYNMSTISQINQLMTHGRIIYLELEENNQNQGCHNLKKIAQQYQSLFNYICFFDQKNTFTSTLNIDTSTTNNIVFIIDKSLKDIKKIEFDAQSFNAYNYLPNVPARQKVSGQSQAQMCLKTAFASQRDPVFYWYNQKQHKSTLRLLQYFNSLPEVTSLIYFCQIYLPDDNLIKSYKLNENCLFSMTSPSNARQGELQKFEFQEALTFPSIKMFLRELAIMKMTKVYQAKLLQNKITQVFSSQDLTKECFSKGCIVLLSSRKRFRYDIEIETMKQLKLQLSGQEFNWVEIDGDCHWDVARQLKLIDRKAKQMDRSYVFYYKEKTNQYALMKSSQSNKYWVKKDVKKWIKTLKQTGTVKRLKFGIDIQDKKCEKVSSKQQKSKEKIEEKTRNNKSKINHVEQDEL